METLRFWQQTLPIQAFLDFVDLNGDNAKDILFVDSVGDQLFWLESQVAPAAETTTITANPIAITADGQSTSTITVQAKDANGNNPAAGGDAVVLATTLGALGAIADNNDGTYTATLTAGVVAGTATITGTINGAAITDDADVAFNVGAPLRPQRQRLRPTRLPLRPMASRRRPSRCKPRMLTAITWPQAATLLF